MRKMTEGNKARFLVFAILIVATIIVLLVFLTKTLGFEKESYSVEKEIFMYDSDYEYIDLEYDAVIEKKWTGKYYLTEPETGKSYDLGTTAIAYDSIKNRISLFGTFYEVALDGEVSKVTKNTDVSDMLNPKLYKIEDRKYLITGRNISNESGTLRAENYLIVVIDKSGNTLLLNNRMDLKTINAIVLETDTFKFDVANEKLIYEDTKIDLKKIIGSTNQYVEPIKIAENNNNEDDSENINVGGGVANATTSTSIQIGSPTIVNTGGTTATEQTTNQNTGNSQNTTNSSPSNSQTNINPSIRENTNQNKAKAAKSVNLKGINPGGTYLDVSYSVIDPENEYQVVYLSITGGGTTNTISLDKGKDYYRITDLQQNTDYTIILGYKEIKSDSTTEDVSEDIINIKTLKLEGKLEITKITNSKIYYNLKLDSSSSYDNAKIYVYINGNRQSGYIAVDTVQALTEKGWSSSLDKTDSMIGKLTLTLVDVKELDLSASVQIY